MVGKLMKSIYKYENCTLESGFIVNAQAVTIESGKITYVSNAIVTKEGVDSWNFSLDSYSGSLKCTTNSVPFEVDGRAVVLEFIAFVESDIV